MKKEELVSLGAAHMGQSRLFETRVSKEIFKSIMHIERRKRQIMWEIQIHQAQSLSSRDDALT